MLDKPAFELSTAERRLLTAVAHDVEDTPDDWVAAQRLKQWGLLEDHAVLGVRVTAAGRAALRPADKDDLSP